MIQVRRVAGFTLIELMVTLTVIVVMLVVAVPSFRAFQQRSALKAASEQALGIWNQARMEAAKRNAFVKVGTVTTGTNYCIGAATTPAVNNLPPVASDVDPCDCFETDPTVVATFCNVARFPGTQAEWRQVSIVGTPTIGGGENVAVIEPRNNLLTAAADAGSISFLGPPGRNSYRLNLRIDGLGRGRICESTNAGTSMSEYATRRCTD